MAFRRGLLVLGAGESTVRLCPPLTITPEQADLALEVLQDCLAALPRA
jgi:4-aminobutyrate aminotransferase